MPLFFEGHFHYAGVYLKKSLKSYNRVMQSEKPIDIALDIFIASQADSIFRSIRESSPGWKSEEDVRHGCNHLLDQFMQDLAKTSFGVEVGNILSNHEVPVSNGRIDSLYGCVLIEYKKPDIPRNKTEEESLSEQIKGYFASYSAKNNVDQKKLLGVGWNGSKALFVTKPGDSFEVEPLSQMTIYHIKKILKAILRQGSIGKSYTADNLAQDFGSANIRTCQGIKNIYDCIEKADHPKTITIFKQWKMFFGEVCGFDVEGKNDKVKSLADFYEIGKKDVDSAKLLFSVHTYYSLFIKLMTAEVLSIGDKYGLSFVKRLSKSESPKLLKEMSEIENGSAWKKRGFKNLLEGDLFSWYISSWDSNIADAIRSIAERLADYDANSLATDDKGKKDLLKSLYQMLFPKTLRHDLGEYYTPDWLAELVLNELGYDGSLKDLSQKRLLDPACGSGTFLVEAINRVINWNEKRPYEDRLDDEELLQHITSNIVGFDLNPLAVIASRVNYLLAVSDLAKRVDEVEIPVYLCDSIMTPSEFSGDLFLDKARLLSTVEGVFKMPISLTDGEGTLGKFTDMLEQFVEVEGNVDILLKNCRWDLFGGKMDPKDEMLVKELYTKIMKLKHEDRNGIWVRIIKNAFAPLFCGKFDFVAGNPPWINWESLPEGYRKSSIDLWEYYELRPEKGQLGRMKGGKKDISMLMTYVAHDYYLNDNGKLGFVITQSVFKTRGGGEGFRSFSYAVNGNPRTYLRPISVHDLSDFQPFEGATNRTAVFICDKSSEPFSYPVPYTVWKKTCKGQIDTKINLEKAMECLASNRLEAIPVNDNQKDSPWLTASHNALSGIQKVIGQSFYQAHEGINSGGLNGCFWIQILEKMKNGNLFVENLHDVGKKKCERVQEVIEPDLVYPLLRGRDVRRWKSEPSAYIIISQDKNSIREGMPVDEMQMKYPKTYGYFYKFKELLSKRADFKFYPKESPFYTMRNVGPYTMSPWKVVYKDLTEWFQAAVLCPNENKTTLPDVTNRFISLDSPEESHYLCALLNSSPSKITLRTSAVEVQTARYHPSDIQKLNLPKFDPSNKTHAKLAKLSQRAHEAAKAGDNTQLSKIEDEIDTEAAKLWGITPEELDAIRQAIAESKAPAEAKTAQDEEE